MKISVKGILGIHSLESRINKGKLTLVIGDNSQGKTSFLNACKAVLAGDPDPARVGGRGQGSAYVNDEAEAGIARLETDNGERWFKPGSSPIGETGAETLCAKAAVGITDLFAATTMEGRAKMWEEELGCNEIPDDVLLDRLSTAMFDCSYDQINDERQRRQCISVLDTINNSGWDAAQEYWRKVALESKKDWVHAVDTVDPGYASVYGVKKALEWRPPNSNVDQLNMTVAEAERDLRTAKDEYETALQLVGADAAININIDQCKQRLVEIQHNVSGIGREIENLHKDKDKVSKSEGEIQGTIEDYKQQLNDLIVLVETRKKIYEVICPSCGAELKFDKDDPDPLYLSNANRHGEDDLDDDSLDDQIKFIRSELERLNKKKGNLFYEKRKFSDRISEINNRRAGYNGEIKQLTQQIESASNAPSAEALESQHTAKDNLERASEALANVTAWTKAQDAHNSVQYCTKIKALLQTSGIRSEYMTPRMDKIRAIVNNFTAKCGWEDIDIDDKDYGISYNGRSVKLCSASEQWRAHAILQIAIAIITKSSAVVIDNGEVLSEGNRQSFIRIVSGLLFNVNWLAVLMGITMEDYKIDVEHIDYIHIKGGR